MLSQRLSSRRARPLSRHSLLEGLELRTLFAAPVGVADLLAVTQDTALTFNYLQLNDTDADNDTLSVTAVGTAAHGTLVSNGSSSFTYTPTTGYVGLDSFTYTVSDGTNTATGTASVIVNATMDVATARSTIMAGVTTTIDPGGPDEIIPYGPTAYPIAQDASGDYALAAATWGAGKVLAMDDHQYLETSRDTGTSTMATLYQNGISWLANSTSKALKVVTFSTTDQTYLQGKGYTNVVVATTGNLTTQLSGASVFFAGWLGSSFSDSNLNIIANFVRGGGGLWVTDYGIGYTGYGWWSGGLPNAPGNRLLREAGIAFADSDLGLGLTLSTSTEHLTQEDVINKLAGTGSYTATQITKLGHMLNAMFGSLKTTDTLYARLNQNFWAAVASINPTPSTPVSDAWQVALVHHESDVLKTLPVAQVTKHRTTEATYGVVPAAAPRVTQTVTINTNTSRWHATGLYNAPGEISTITVPASLVNKGYTIEINAHTDTVNRTTLERMPYVHRSFTITSTVTQVACAFGGSIFIDLNGDAYSGAPNLGNVDITVANAVEQPYFVLGKNTNAEWNSTLRARPAPFAVFVSDNLIVTLPKSQVESADLIDPERLMTYWHESEGWEDWLNSRLRPRASAEMINVDVQQSAGAAHSGYPIQAYQKFWNNMADLDSLLYIGSHGNFHELGHNHQQGWWTFGSGGEVTCNIFSNIVSEMTASDAYADGGWGKYANPTWVMTTAITNVNNTAIAWEAKDQYTYYAQLADCFGWEAFRDVFRSYEIDQVANPSALPSGEQAEKDQWFIRWCKETGYDLTYFMSTKWKLEVSAAALSTVAAMALPSYSPVGLSYGAKPVGVLAGTPYTFNIAGSSLSFDGTATIVNVSSATNGTVTLASAGKYTYTPNANYVGPDSFFVTLQSSQGNQSVCEVKINVTNIGAKLDMYTGISGTSISSVPASTVTPNQIDYVTQTEAPVNRADSIAQRLQTYIVPKTTGTYYFYIASDDTSELYLTTTARTRIAYLTAASSPRQWTKSSTQKSAAITLTAGNRYLLEAIMKEGTGSDSMSVAWTTPGSTKIYVIGGDYLRWGANVIPSVATPAAASQITTTDKTVNLSALGADDDGEAWLSYAWSVSGPAAVTYSDNNTNTAKNALATFTKPGTYVFTCTIKDRANQTTTTQTTVTVNAVAAAVTLTPNTATVPTNGTQQFTATVYDQFNQVLTGQTLNWSVVQGLGTVSGTGLFTAASTASTSKVRVTVGNVSASSTVTTYLAAFSAPTNLTSKKPTSNTLQLLFKDNSTTEVGFTIQKGVRNALGMLVWTTVGARPGQVGSGTTLTYTVPGTFTPGTYYFRVRAYTATTTSGWSNTATAVF